MRTGNQLRVQYLLPFGNQVCIRKILPQTEVVQLTGDLTLFVVHLVDVAALLVVQSKNWP